MAERNNEDEAEKKRRQKGQGAISKVNRNPRGIDPGLPVPSNVSAYTLNHGAVPPSPRPKTPPINLRREVDEGSLPFGINNNPHPAEDPENMFGEPNFYQRGSTGMWFGEDHPHRPGKEVQFAQQPPTAATADRRFAPYTNLPRYNILPQPRRYDIEDEDTSGLAVPLEWGRPFDREGEEPRPHLGPGNTWKPDAFDDAPFEPVFARPISPSELGAVGGEPEAGPPRVRSRVEMELPPAEPWYDATHRNFPQDGSLPPGLNAYQHSNVTPPRSPEHRDPRQGLMPQHMDVYGRARPGVSIRDGTVPQNLSPPPEHVGRLSYADAVYSTMTPMHQRWRDIAIGRQPKPYQDIPSPHPTRREDSKAPDPDDLPPVSEESDSEESFSSRDTEETDLSSDEGR